MAKIASEKEQQLQLLFKKVATEIEAGKADAIEAVRDLCLLIDEAKLVEEVTEICATVRSGMTAAGLKKNARWYGKYIEAKYKRPQKTEGQKEFLKAINPPETVAFLKKNQAKYAAEHPEKKPKVASKTRLKVKHQGGDDVEMHCEGCNCIIGKDPTDWENDFDGEVNKQVCISCYKKRHPDVKFEKCPDCDKETANPENLGELNCVGCGGTFYIDTDVVEEKPAKKACKRCGLKLKEKEQDFETCSRCAALAGKTPAQIAEEEKAEAIERAKLDKVAIHIIIPGKAPFSIGTWDATTYKKRALFDEQIQWNIDWRKKQVAEECTKHGLTEKDIRIKVKAVPITTEAEEKASILLAEDWNTVTKFVNEYLQKRAADKKKDAEKATGTDDTRKIAQKKTEQKPGPRKAVAEEPGKDGGPAAPSASKKKQKEKAPPIKQVERTREEGYSAYEGDASKKLDQPHINEKKYTHSEIMATPIYTYSNDPADKNLNTHVCGHCGSSKLDWTSIGFRGHQDDGKEYLLKVSNCKGCPRVYNNVGFFQCATCHAFLIEKDNVRSLKIEKQADGSYKYNPEIGKLTPQDALTKKPEDLEEAEELLAMARGMIGKAEEAPVPVADPLRKDKMPMEVHAFISLDTEGKIATPNVILNRLLKGEDLDHGHPLLPVQQALKEYRKKAEQEAKLAADLKVTVEQLQGEIAGFVNDRSEERLEADSSEELRVTTRKLATALSEMEDLKGQLVQAKKELATRATKEETAKLEALTVQVEELKAELKETRQQLTRASITTADKLQDFWIFVPRKRIPEVAKAIDKVNWDKKLLGFSVRTDGKFAIGFREGEPI